MVLGHGLEPYGLPDTGHGSIPYAVGVADLFAARLCALVGGVVYADCART